jgi:hypothetical protein
LVPQAEGDTAGLSLGQSVLTGGVRVPLIERPPVSLRMACLSGLGWLWISADLNHNRTKHNHANVKIMFTPMSNHNEL